jgi:hypothetical protein
MVSLKEVKRAKLILDLEKYKIPLPILEYVAKRVRSPIAKSTRLLKVYESMDNKALNMLHRAFVKCEIDKQGKFLEFRLANYLMRQFKNVVKADFRKKCHGASGVSHEIDVVGYNAKEEVIAIGECKTGLVTKDHISKWLKEIDDIAKSGEYDKLDQAFFLSAGGYTEDSIKMIRDVIDKNGVYKIKLGALQSFYVYLSLLEERKGKIYAVLPKR